MKFAIITIITRNNLVLFTKNSTLSNESFRIKQNGSPTHIFPYMRSCCL